jgi:N-acetylglutamate synthase-like GNAT family acetyltransferase
MDGVHEIAIRRANQKDLSYLKDLLENARS